MISRAQININNLKANKDNESRANSKGKLFRKRINDYRSGKDSLRMKFNTNRGQSALTVSQMKDMKIRGKPELSKLSKDLIS